MIRPVACPSCSGMGCRKCNFIGYFGSDGQQEYYLDKDAKGNIIIAGVKKSGGSDSSILSNLLGAIFSRAVKSLEEPHDFLWEVKNKKN